MNIHWLMNDWNLPTYKQKNGNDNEDLEKQKKRILNRISDCYYKGKLLQILETRWFEFEWNVNGSQMQVSKIKDEKGENKEFLHEWPMLDNKLNWLMFTTGWQQSAIHTTYIINGNPTDKQLYSQMDMIL